MATRTRCLAAAILSAAFAGAPGEPTPAACSSSDCGLPLELEEEQEAHVSFMQQDAQQLAGASLAGYKTWPYEQWSNPVKWGKCSPDATPQTIEGGLTCATENGIKTYRFPAGIFEIGEQMLVPDKTAIIGANDPNDMSDPTKAPDWKQQTLFLATKGVTNYWMWYCKASDMVHTRVGFVLGSDVTLRNVAYQGVDTIRPEDNGALCGGGAIETKGCAANDCGASNINNGGSDGMGSINVVIENVRLNDYHYADDRFLVGASVDGNYDCKTTDFRHGECCFCKPNGVRSTQVAVWVPASRNPEGTQNIVVRNLVSSSNQADGINLHGMVDNAEVSNVYIQNTGDDTYALWGAKSNPTNVAFRNCVAVNPGILRPKWYGTCVATYGLKSVVFENMVCKSPALPNPIPSPGDHDLKIDVTMFVFHADFWASYPPDHSIQINGWTFTDLQGAKFQPSDGTTGKPVVGKMVWTKSPEGVMAPYYIANGPPLNIHVST